MVGWLIGLLHVVGPLSIRPGGRWGATGFTLGLPATVLERRLSARQNAGGIAASKASNHAEQPSSAEGDADFGGITQCSHGAVPAEQQWQFKVCTWYCARLLACV